MAHSSSSSRAPGTGGFAERILPYAEKWVEPAGTQGWLICAVIPFTGLEALTAPAITTLMSRRVASNSQGELQGAPTGELGATLTISPVLTTQTFGYFTSTTAPIYLPVAPFLGAAALMALAFAPFSIGVRRMSRRGRAHPDCTRSYGLGPMHAGVYIVIYVVMSVCRHIAAI